MSDLGSLGSVAIIAIIAVFLNRLLGIPQQIRLNKKLTELKRRGPVSSVGISKSFFAGMRIAVLISDKSGNILEAYRVRGKTVFSSYELDKDFPYTSCYDIQEHLGNKKKLTEQEKAYLSAAGYLVSGLHNLETSEDDSNEGSIYGDNQDKQ